MTSIIIDATSLLLQNDKRTADRKRERQRLMQHTRKIPSEEQSLSSLSSPRPAMSAWNDQDAAAIINWISKLPPRSSDARRQGDSAATTENENENECIALVILPKDGDTTLVQWQKENPGISLSHMDSYTRGTLLACPIEIKKNGGDYNEAVCQLAVWSAAALTKLKALESMGGDRKMVEGFPYPGWTIVGDEWRLHISWKEKDDSGRVVSGIPFRSILFFLYFSL